MKKLNCAVEVMPCVLRRWWMSSNSVVLSVGSRRVSASAQPWWLISLYWSMCVGGRADSTKALIINDRRALASDGLAPCTRRALECFRLREQQEDHRSGQQAGRRSHCSPYCKHVASPYRNNPFVDVGGRPLAISPNLLINSHRPDGLVYQ